METFTRSRLHTWHLPRWKIPRLFGKARRRRRAMIDLIHSSPHLLRDIGLIEQPVVQRGP